MFRLVRLAPLYMALCLGADAVAADGVEDLLAGDMRAMALHEEPQEVPAVSFTDADGVEMTLAGSSTTKVEYTNEKFGGCVSSRQSRRFPRCR